MAEKPASAVEREKLQKVKNFFGFHAGFRMRILEKTLYKPARICYTSICCRTDGKAEFRPNQGITVPSTMVQAKYIKEVTHHDEKRRKKRDYCQQRTA